MKIKPAFKVLIVLAVIAVLTFCVFNVVWLVFFNQHVKPFRDAIGFDESKDRYYYIDPDKYTYSISYSYLTFDAQLQISEVRSLENNIVGNLYIDVSSDEIDYNAVVTYINAEDGHSETNSFHLNKHMQLLDPDGNVIENPTNKEKSQYDKAYSELKILFDKADNMWELPDD